MFRPQSLTVFAKALLIAALALCSAAAVAQTALIQSQDTAQMEVACPAILCNCIQGTEVACQDGSCTPTYACGLDGNLLCDGCK